MKMRKVFAGLAVAGSLVSNIPLGFVNASFEGYTDNNYCATGGSTTDESGNNGTGGAVTGDWLTKGTEANKNAQQTWDTLVKKEGFGGAGAAGALANARRESNFDPTAHNPGGGVAGLFQWSGFSNSVNGSRITQGGFIKAGDVSTLTMENEMKLLDLELNGSYKKAKTTVGNESDPGEAAMQWTELYEGVSVSDGQAKVEETKNYARQAYTAFGGADIPPNSAIIGGNDAATNGETEAAASTDDCDSSGTLNDGTIVEVAKSMLGYFTYEQVHGVKYIGSVENPDKNGQTDCSGFVWLALKKAGYKVPDDMAWYTKTMEDDAKGEHKYLKEISESEAGPGDVIIVNTADGAGSNGHTVILTEKWKGDDTQVIQMGGYPGDGVNIHGFKESMLSLLEAGGKPVFARPIKE